MLPGALLILLFGVTPALADVRVDIEGIDGDALRNVVAFLSVERYKARSDLDADTLLRLYNRIDDEVRAALRPLGFYEPSVQSSYEATGNGNNWRIKLGVQPGPPVLIGAASVVIEGDGADDALFQSAREHPTLQPGQQLHHGTYETVKGDLLRNAAAAGYLDAKLLQSELRVDPVQHVAYIDLHLATGPRYRFGALSIDQSVIRPELMRRFVRFKEGDPYSSTQLLRTQFALDDSLYFSTVEVQPMERDPATLTVPVRISAQQSRRSYSLGGGYGTDTGPRGTFGWTDSRLNERGHRLRLEIKASAITQSFDSRYDIPIGDPAVERLSLQLLRRADITADLHTEELSFTPSLTQMQGRWQRVLSLAATHTRTDDGINVQTSNLLVPGISYASVPEGYLGEALFSRGFYADLIGSTRVLGSDASFLRLHVQTERVFDLQPQWHLLMRGELGASVTQHFDNLPGIYRFFAGGDRSVRGFAFNVLAPKENYTAIGGSVEQRIVGGRHLLVGSAEIARDLPRNFALATFFDIGNAFDRFGDPLAYSAGVGVRYRLPVVSIGLDIAQPLSQSGSPRLHLNISPKL